MSIDRSRLTGMEQFDEMTALRELMHDAPENATVVVSPEGVVSASWDTASPSVRVRFLDEPPSNGAADAWAELQGVEFGPGTMSVSHDGGPPVVQFGFESLKLSPTVPEVPVHDERLSIGYASTSATAESVAADYAAFRKVYGNPSAYGTGYAGAIEETTADPEPEGASLTILPNGRVVKEYVSKKDLLKYLGPKEASKQLAMLANPTGNRAQRRAAGKLIARKLKKGQPL
jgi:hypothetical protein